LDDDNILAILTKSWESGHFIENFAAIFIMEK